MKNFKEKEVKNLNEVVGGVGEVQIITLSARIRKDEWNCNELVLDFHL